MKRILCYGDSNTWGFIPATGQRYPSEIRWTGVLAELLGPEYEIIEDGISGRTTVWDDPYVSWRNGLKGLGYSLLRSKPIDLVVMMLGCNDLYHTDAYGYYRGLSQIAWRIINAREFYRDSSAVFREEPKLLLVSPVTLHPQIGTIRPELNLGERYKDSCQFAFYTRRLAEELKVPWVDAATCASASEQDGLHLDPESHRAIAEMLAEKIKSVFV